MLSENSEMSGRDFVSGAIPIDISSAAGKLWENAADATSNRCVSATRTEPRHGNSLKIRGDVGLRFQINARDTGIDGYRELSGADVNFCLSDSQVTFERSRGNTLCGYRCIVVSCEWTASLSTVRNRVELSVIQGRSSECWILTSIECQNSTISMIHPTKRSLTGLSSATNSSGIRISQISSWLN